MSVSRIASMMETLKEMEEMQNKVNKDIDKDINKKRKEALKQIREYLNDVADVIDRPLRINLPDGTIFSSYNHGQSIEFHCKYRVSSGGFNGTVWSEEPVKWQLSCYNSTKKDNSNFYEYIDHDTNIETANNPKHWASGYINLIENWNEIKCIIENAIEKELTDRMEQVRKNTSNRIESYKKVDNFEV